MKITTLVQTTDPNYPYNETQAAAQVLAALGGDASDTSKARVQRQANAFTTNVELESGDVMQYTPDQAAQQVLAALAGNPTRDSCTVTITMPPTSGHAGR